MVLAGVCALARDQKQESARTDTSNRVNRFFGFSICKTLMRNFSSIFRVRKVSGNYQTLFAEDAGARNQSRAIKRCEPKLTVGNEIVRNVPRPLLIEIFKARASRGTSSSEPGSVWLSLVRTGAGLTADSRMPVPSTFRATVELPREVLFFGVTTG